MKRKTAAGLGVIDDTYTPWKSWVLNLNTICWRSYAET